MSYQPKKVSLDDIIPGLDKEIGNDIFQPIKSEGAIKKIREYRLFVIWRTIPAMAMEDVDELAKMGFPEEYVDLCRIKTQKEFAKKYKVNEDTFADWKRRSHFRIDCERAQRQIIGHAFANEIDFAFAKKTLLEADSARFKLFKQYFQGINLAEHIEHSGKVEHDHTIDDALSKYTPKQLKELRAMMEKFDKANKKSN